MAVARLEGEEAARMKQMCEMMKMMTEALEKPREDEGRVLKRLDALENKIHLIPKQVEYLTSIKSPKPEARSSSKHNIQPPSLQAVKPALPPEQQQAKTPDM